ncbi:MAG: hypothetical protein ACE5E9_03625 [Nitrospinaceae bacterium]
MGGFNILTQRISEVSSVAAFHTKLIIPVLVLLGIAGLNSPREAATEAQTPVQNTYEVSARVDVTHGKFQAARKQAVTRAMKSAVEEALRDLMGDQTFDTKRPGLARMLGDPKPYVQSYRFLRAYDDPVEKVTEVTLEVSLFPNAVRKSLNRLGMIPGEESAKNVVILIREKSFTSKNAAPFWDTVPISETALVRNFTEARVQVIPRDSIVEEVPEETVLNAIKGNLNDAVTIGLKAGADIVIVGSAVSTRLETPGVRRLTTVRTNISVRVISVSNSGVMAAKSDFATAQKADPLEGELEAFGVVSKKISDFLLPTLGRYWKVGTGPRPPAPAARKPAAPSLPLSDL